MKVPKILYVAAVIFLLWALLGNVAFLTDVTGDLDKPVWVWAAYGVAVLAGLLGAIALLLRRKVAVPIFALSLVATLIQYAYTFFGTDVIAENG